MGFLPSISGLSWLVVLTMETLPPSLSSHTQPLPKRPAPALPHSVLKLSKLENAALIASAILPLGAPPAFGAIHFQNCEWFQWPPPLLRTAVRMSSGTLLMPRHSSSTLLLSGLGWLWFARRVSLVVAHRGG